MTIAAGYGNVSDFEAIFLLISVFGFVFSVLNLINVVGDYDYLKQEGIKNGRWLLAKAAIVTESGRCYLQAVFIYVAVLAMTHPDPPPQTEMKDIILSAIARWAFLFGAIWVAAKTAYAWHVRRRLLENGILNKDVNHETG